MNAIGNRTGFAKGLVVAVAIAASLAFAAVPVAGAADPDDPYVPYYSFEQFNPELEVGTSTSRAGAHPDLVIRMQKPMNRCLEFDPDSTSEPPIECAADPDAVPPLDPPTEGFQVYMEQSLKKMLVNFPPGLVADANAAPYCDAFFGWLPAFGGVFFLRTWQCKNPASMVGTVNIKASACSANEQHTPGYSWLCQSLQPDLPPGVYMDKPGYIYNERPGPGEQGHLVVLWAVDQPDDPPDDFFDTVVKTDIGITVDGPEVRMRSASDQIPDWLQFIIGMDGDADGEPDDVDGDGEPDSIGGPPTTAQMFDMELTLFGATGAEAGHSLLTNPTFCDSQQIEGEFQGYKINARPDPKAPNPLLPGFLPGEGEGKTVIPDSIAYQATDCDALPYAPTFTGTAGTDAPGAAAALSTVITQAEGEAATKKTVVTFPKGMGVNIASTLRACKAADLSAKSCPESSKMGTAVAESRFLPEGETLQGDVFLTGTESDKVTLSVLLTGFIDLEIKGKTQVGDDGTITAVFDNQPPVLTNKFTLNLFGGEKSLLQNPRRCGPATTTAAFTSHSGKVHTVESTSQVKGCNEPTFDAELSEPGKGKRTGLELEVRSDQKPIKEVKFGIDRHMKLTSRGLGKKRKFGEVSVTSASGTQEAALKRSVGASQKKVKAFSLKVSTLDGLGVSIYRKHFIRKGSKTFKNKKNTRSLKKKTVPKNRVSVKPLPTDDTTKVLVSLNPNETKLLRNPKGKCRTDFIALIKTTDGVKYALKQKLKMRGKGCSRKKAKKN